MMKISHLNSICDSAHEAELIVTDGAYECLVFCQPCYYKIGDTVEDVLHAFIVKDLVLSNKDTFHVRRNSVHGFSQSIVAKVIDNRSNTVAVGKIKIELPSSIPFPVNEGQFVEFKCLRLDLW